MTGQLGFLGNGAEIIQLAAKTLTFRVRLACSSTPPKSELGIQNGKMNDLGKPVAGPGFTTFEAASKSSSKCFQFWFL